jgi:hypothetical protein
VHEMQDVKRANNDKPLLNRWEDNPVLLLPIAAVVLLLSWRFWRSSLLPALILIIQRSSLIECLVSRLATYAGGLSHENANL